MKAQFDVIRPTTVEQAIALREKHGKGARFWAGGTDMTLQWQRRQIDLDCCVDITGLDGLDRIEVTPTAITIGALVTLAELERAGGRHPLLASLAAVAQLMCTPQTRNLATVGGNLCNASPAADLSPAFVALAAEVVIAGAKAEHRMAMEAFFIGAKRTVLAPSDILTRIVIPLPAGRTASSYRRVARTVVDIALVNAAASITVDERREITRARIGLGAVAPVILRAFDGESLLVGQRIDAIPLTVLEAAGEKASAIVKPITDVRASAGFRRHMIKILTRRALEDCVRELGGTVA